MYWGIGEAGGEQGGVEGVLGMESRSDSGLVRVYAVGRRAESDFTMAGSARHITKGRGFRSSVRVRVLLRRGERLERSHVELILGGSGAGVGKLSARDKDLCCS